MKVTSFLAPAVIVVQLWSAPVQQCTSERTAPQNLNFAEGVPGVPPPGWFLDPEHWLPAAKGVYEAQIVAGDSCIVGAKCATVRSLRANPPNVPLAFLDQDIDPNRFRGKRFYFSAMVRVEGPAGGVARLLVRVHRLDCTTTFFDNLGNSPITSNSWSQYQIQGPIAADATHMEFGLQLIGQGQAWIDGVSAEFIDAR